MSMKLLIDNGPRAGSALAHDAKDVPGAQEYARQCWAAGQKRKSLSAKILGALKADPIPTGLYAECVARLGEIPPPVEAKIPIG